MTFELRRSLRKLAPALAIVVIAFTAACGGDSTGSRAPTGTFTLRSVNGHPLPLVLDEGYDPAFGNYADTLKYGAITLGANNTYSDSISGRSAWSGGTTYPAGTYAWGEYSSGTFSFQNGTVTAIITATRTDGEPNTQTSPDTVSFTVEGSRLTGTHDGVTFIFQK